MEPDSYEYEKFISSRTQTKESERIEELKVTPVSYFQLYKFSTFWQKILLAFAVVFCLISGTAEALFFLVFGKSLGDIVYFGTDLANATNETEINHIKENFLRKINTFGIHSISLTLVVFVFFYAGTALFNYTAMKQSFRIRQLYFSKVVYQDISWHDRNSTGDFASRVADDLKKIEDGIGEKAAMVLYYVASIIVCATESFIVGWQLTLVGFSISPLFFIAAGIAGKFSSKLAKNATERSGDAGKIADETFSYIKTVVAFNGQKVESDRYDQILDTSTKASVRKSFYDAILDGITQFFMYCAISILIWYGNYLIMRNPTNEVNHTVGSLAMIYNGVCIAFYYFGGITPYLQVFSMARGASEKIFSTIQSESVINKSYEGGEEVEDDMPGAITFSDVQFSYPARKDVQILKGFNLSIKPGETVALVGSSGCGKSTVIQLILRYYDVADGGVFIDEKDVGKLNLRSLRNKIGLVGQEPVLFEGTITDNIKMGRLGATQAEVEDAAKNANAHGFILSFPDGYGTLIGERGAQLSGGQKQRIAIARALVRRPKILLLDEATSALDSHSERVVQATLEEVSRDCTTVIVAHRLSTVRKADRIVVLEDGKVVEEGSHDALMTAKGAYHKLVKMQMSKDAETENDGSMIEHDIEESVKKTLSDPVTNEIKEVSTKTKLKFSEIWKILWLNLRPRWCFICGVLAAVACGFGTVACSFLLGLALTKLGEPNSEYVKHQVNLYATFIFIIGLVLVGVARFIQSYLIGIAGEHMVKNLRSSMFKTMIHTEIGWFDRSENGVGSLGARLAGEPSSVQMTISIIGTAVYNLTLFLLLLIIGFSLSWKLILGMLSVSPVMFLFLYLQQRVLVKETERNMEVLETSTKLAVEVINNIRTVASLAIEDSFVDRYVSKLNTYKSVFTRNVHIGGIVNGFSNSLFMIYYTVAIFYGGHLILMNVTVPLVVISVTQVFVTTMFNLMFTVAFIPNLIIGLVACSRIHETLSQAHETPTCYNNEQSNEQIEGDIAYKSVSFSYPTRPDTQILKDLDLLVLRGKTVALVGPSGCGKSTIVQLLQRFYEPQLGRIMFGETNIARVHPEKLRFRLGMVMQEPNLFSRSIEENIAYGNTGGIVTKDEVIRSAQMANIHNFITSLPLGYETVLGERGTQLSGGQKQRIAIARALIRNPEVLLLDEATSALDSESEKIVQEAINNVKEERTCIVIAHRLKTIEDSDVIAVMDGGSVVEKGTHPELISKKGLYWRLYNKQRNSHE